MLGGGGDGSAVGPGSPWTRVRLCCTSSVPRRELSLSWRDIGTGCLVLSTQQWPHAHPASPYRHSDIPISLPIWQHAPPVPQNAAHAPEAPHSSRQATPSWTKLGALTAAARSSNAISGAAPRGPGARSRLRLPCFWRSRAWEGSPPFQRLKHVAPPWLRGAMVRGDVRVERVLGGSRSGRQVLREPLLPRCLWSRSSSSPHDERHAPHEPWADQARALLR